MVVGASVRGVCARTDKTPGAGSEAASTAPVVAKTTCTAMLADQAMMAWYLAVLSVALS